MMLLSDSNLSLVAGLGYTISNCVVAYRKLTIQPNKIDLVK